MARAGWLSDSGGDMPMLVGIDPGSSTGIALWDGEQIAFLGTLKLGDTDGATEALMLFRQLDPALVIVEDPPPVQSGSSAHSRYTLQRRLGAILALAQVAWPSARIELVKTAVWQSWAHAGRVEADPKDRSLGRVMKGPISVAAMAELRGPRGGLRTDAADAGCLALWGALCKV